MATAQVVQSKPVTGTEAEKPSRREFLYYVWSASIALALGGAAAGVTWYMLPRPQKGAIVIVRFPDLPRIGAAPLSLPEQHLYISHTNDDALVALYRFCTFRRDFLPKWVPLNHRFECPSCGSKYRLNGLYIEGPAPRSLDRFHMTITFADGTTAITNDAGDPIFINGREIASVIVDTRRLIEGARRANTR